MLLCKRPLWGQRPLTSLFRRQFVSCTASLYNKPLHVSRQCVCSRRGLLFMWTDIQADGVRQGKRPLASKASSFLRDENIRANRVVLIDEEGKRIGEMTRKDALAHAHSRALHVVQVATRDTLPVCRLMSKAKVWESDNIAKKNERKNYGSSEAKELKMSSKISDHDLEVKLKQIVRFLDEKRLVLVTIYTTKRIHNYHAASEERVSVMEKITEKIEGKGFVNENIKFNAQGGRALIFRLKAGASNKQGQQRRETRRDSNHVNSNEAPCD